MTNKPDERSFGDTGAERSAAADSGNATPLKVSIHEHSCAVSSGAGRTHQIMSGHCQ